MKFIILCTVIACVAIPAGVLGSPIGISGNNVGNVVTIGVNLDADVNTKIDTTIVNVLVAILTHLGDVKELPPPEQIAAALQQISSAPRGAEVDFSEATAFMKELLGHLKEPAQLKELLSSEQAAKLFEQFFKQ